MSEAIRQQTAPEPGEPDSIPIGAQARAVAWVRWRLFANSFRRQGAGGRGSLALAIGLRILLWPLIAALCIGPVVGCGFLGWLMGKHGDGRQLAPLLGGIFLFWQYFSLQGTAMAAASGNFHPADLLRFPVAFRRYLLLRFLVGVLTLSTICGCMALLAAAVGLSIARPALLGAAFGSLALYALLCVLFTRMLNVWLERWLATRRAREILALLTLVLVVITQFWNLHAAGQRMHGSRGVMFTLLLAAAPILHALPPGLAASAIFSTAHPARLFSDMGGLLAYGASFYALFALRLRSEYSGESLSDSVRQKPAAPATRSPLPAALPTNHALPGARERTLSTFAACARKEWIYLRDNPRQLVSLVTLFFFVFILTSPTGLLGHHPAYLLAGSIAYVLFGPLLALFNIFGADGAGVQLYFLAPVHAGSVLLAKNLVNIALLTVEVTLTWAIVLWRAAHTVPIATQAATGVWIVFVLALSLSIGSLRSIQSPRRFVPGQARRSSRASQTSLLLTFGVVFGSLLLQIPVTMLAQRLHQPWLPAAMFAPCALLAVGGYGVLLARANRLMLAHRETLIEELCKN